MANNTLNLSELKTMINYFIDNNKKLVANGKRPITVNVEGPAGCGKTSIIEEIAEERGMAYTKLVLSQLDEIGDLVGFPIKEYKIKELQEDGTTIEKWVSNDLLSTYFQMPCESYEITNESRMSYATPKWLPREYNPNGYIVNLDDYSRAGTQFMQCVMELIDRQSFMSWRLPENTFLCCTSNPDDGNYSVTALDSAQKSRLVNFNVDFDVDVWARYAEYANIEPRAINFALYYASELFKNDGVNAINARNYTIFCNAISGISDWSKSESLSTILTIAKGCFTDDKNVIGHLFTMFIANKLDKLISPEDLLKGDWDTIVTKAKACVYDNGTYRADIAAVLSTRFLNYSMKYFDTKGSKEIVVCDRLLKFVEASSNKAEQIFSEDLIFNIAKSLVTKYPGRTNKLMMNSKIRKALM